MPRTDEQTPHSYISLITDLRAAGFTPDPPANQDQLFTLKITIPTGQTYYYDAAADPDIVADTHSSLPSVAPSITDGPVNPQ